MGTAKRIAFVVVVLVCSVGGSLSVFAAAPTAALPTTVPATQIPYPTTPPYPTQIPYPTAVPTHAPSRQPNVLLSPTGVISGSTLLIDAANFTPGGGLTFYWDVQDGAHTIGQQTVDSYGNASMDYVLKNTSFEALGVHRIITVQDKPAVKVVSGFTVDPTTGTQSNGNYCASGPFGLCLDVGALIGNFFGAIGNLLGNSVKALTTPFGSLLTQNPNLTDRGKFTELNAFFDSMQQEAIALFVGILVVGSFRYLLAAITGGDFYAAIGIIRTGTVSIVALYSLPVVLSLWFQLTNQLSTDIGAVGSDLGVGAFVKIFTFITAGFVIGGPGAVIIFGVVLLILALLFMILIGVTRIEAILLMACLYAIAPLCIVCYAAPDSRRFTRWWVEAFLNVSLIGVGYAVASKIITIMLFGLAKEPGFTDAVIQPLMGIAGFALLLRVPRIVGSVVGGATAHAAGVGSTQDTAVGVAKDIAIAKTGIRSLIRKGGK